jgi:hypothetical protein
LLFLTGGDDGMVVVVVVFGKYCTGIDVLTEGLLLVLIIVWQ